jgi:hypothetical protein
MTSASLTFLIVRALHVLLGAMIVGAATFVAFFLEPSLERATPTVSLGLLPVLKRRGMQAFMPAVGGLAVLTGIWLYWRFTGHFDPALSGSMAARIFGAGGVAGILALVVGGSVAGRNARKTTAWAEKAMALPDGPERAAAVAAMNAALRKAAIGGRIALALLVIALLCMSVGHYF